MQKIKSTFSLKRIQVTVILVAVVMLLLGVSLLGEVSLYCAQRDFVALLENNAGRYNEGRLVLSPTNIQEAKHITDALGGSLRITKNGRFALISLPDGMRLSDVAANRELRQYMPQFSLDYNDFSVETEDTDVTTDGDIRANFQSDEPMYPQQTYLDYIHVGDCWNLSMGKTAGGEKVTVAIIDSGIDTDHPEFIDVNGNCIISDRSYDATDDKIVKNAGISVVEDEQGHGTEVAGVIASQVNGKGIMGVAPDVELLIIKCDVFQTGTIKSSSDIIFGIYYAIEQDVDVINMSFAFGYREDLDDALEQIQYALQLAVDSDIIPVAAAGNDNTANSNFPAALESTIAVGALAQDSWELADYSNYGGNSDLLAPGITLTTAMGGGYKNARGTSVSAPVVSAAVALYRSQYPYATYEQVKQNLLAAGKDLGEPGEDLYYGFGALDMNAFLCEEKGTITYDYCTGDLEETTQVFVKQHTIQTVPEPERENIIFDDWYYDKGYTRAFDYDAWYTTEFVEDVTLYAKWVNEDDEGASVYSYRTLENGTIEITRYKGKRRYLTIPDEIDGKMVSSIGVSAFSNNTRLREVIMPTGLEKIGESAFEGVSRLRAVTFTGSSLHTIEQKAFQNCSSLRKLVLPDSVVTIGRWAFADCTVLSVVEITENSALQSIGEYAFSYTNLRNLYLPSRVNGFSGSVLAYCRNMRSVVVHPDNATVVVQDGMVLSADKEALIYYPCALTGTLIVPEGVKAIGGFACTASAITQVVLPQSLTKIETFSFADAKLTFVQIPTNVIKIDDAAFKANLHLTSLAFAEFTLLQMIGDDAFNGCEGLAELELPGSLQVLGKGCFENCRSIPDIFIPDSLEVIGESAFKGCQALKTVAFSPNCKLTSIPNSCFAYCCQLESVDFSDSIQTLEDYSFRDNYMLNTLIFGTGSELTSVGDYCFYSCYALNQMQIPDTVTRIGKYAFAFSGLTSVRIPANLEIIDDGAFGACEQLTEITVDEDHTIYAAVDDVLVSKDLTTVYCVPSSRTGTYTLPDTIQITAPCSFYYDRYLTEIILPEGLEEIQHDSFYSCTSLQYIKIPSSVTGIGRMGFFDCTSMKNVTFGENSQLQRLGLYTFVNCAISEITIPASVETMAQYVFSNCSDLKQITFDADSRLTYVAAYLLYGTQVERVVFEDGSDLTHLQAHAFDGARHLKSVDFGDAALEVIDNYAFYNCSHLEDIILADTVTYLGRYAFYGCSALDRLDVPASVDYVGISAFSGTNSKVFFASDVLPANAQVGWDEGIAGYFLAAKEYVVTEEWEYLITFRNTVALSRYTGSETALTIDMVDGYSVEKIGASCFADNDTITAITIGADVREIDNNAFRDCTAVVTIPDNSILERIGSNAFNGNATERLSLPDTVSSIGSGAFEGSDLKELNISQDSSLRTIGDRAFCGSSIESIYLPVFLESIGAEAFKNTLTLTDVTIADGEAPLKLSNSAFEGSGLTELFIPERVYYIGEYAFGSCPKLENIHVDKGNVAYQSLDGILLGGSGTTLIQYPCGRSGAFEVPAQVTVLNYASFKNAQSLTEVTFAEGSIVKTIGWQTFSGCEKLRKVTVPDTVISFDFYAFENCISLTDVVLGKDTLLIGIYEGAFYGCAALEELSLPDTVIDIGDYAFYGCTALTQFPLSENTQIKGIGAHAFDGCTKVQSIPEFQNLAEIGAYAFARTGITQFDVPITLQDIDSSAFLYCDQLMEIECPDDHEKYESIDGVLYEKGADANDMEAVVLWPYGRIYLLGAGKTILTAEDTAVASMGNGIRWEIADSVITIGAEAFRGNKMIQELVIPSSVTTIESSAFEYCSALRKVTVPASVTTMDIFAFGSCNLLKTAGPTGGDYNYCFGWTDAIPGNAFYYCEGLISCKIPETVTSIGRGAFMGCTNLTDVNLPEGITALETKLFAYCGSLENVQIPAGVTEIKQEAFIGTALTEIWIPESVVYIRDSAFCGTDLISVTIPKTVYSVDIWAFSNCHNLRSVVIEDGVRMLGSGAFRSCTNLEYVFLPNSLTLFVGRSFEHCPKLTSAGPAGGGYNIEYGWNSYIPSNAFSDCKYLTKVVIDPEITEMGSFVFADCPNLTSAGPIGGGYSIEFGWMDVIPACAFMGCSSLKQIALPEGITSIESSAFAKTSLEEVIIPISVATMGGLVFEDCPGLTSAGPVGGDYDIQFYWTEIIPMLAFDGSNYLERVVLPADVKEIGSSAFRSCDSLSTITLPDGVNVIGKYAFSGCSSLQKLVIPDGVTEIGASAFCDCVGLTEITIPQSITKIDISLFAGCSGLEKVSLHNKITEICSAAFYGCSNLAEIVIPRDTTAMGSKVFAGCAMLESAGPVGGDYDIRFYWTDEIPANAFNGCASLKNVILPETVTSIGGGAFGGCTGLTSLPNMEIVTDLGASAFDGCTGLTTAVLPETLTSVGNWAFSGCSNLSRVTIPSGVTTLGIFVFGDCPELITAGPIGGDYNIQFGWNAAIPNNGFYGCNSLTQTVFPDELESIGWYAFSRCTALTELILPEGVKIGSYAFADCSGLSSVIIPKSVTVGERPFSDCTNLVTAGPIGGDFNIQYGWDTTIPRGAFWGCRELVTFEFADGITVIDSDAFRDCVSITEITIPKSVSRIASNSFMDCTKLNKITFLGDAPSVGSTAFWNMIATAYYPLYNDTWTDNILSSSCGGGTITWVGYDPCSGNHHYETIVVSPTCTTQGYTIHTCSVCGYSYVDTYVDALGHDMGEWTTVTEATCTEDGSERRDCSRCDHYEIRPIKATGHSFGTWFVNRAATCTEDGENRRNCNNCSHYETEVIPATGHSYEHIVTAPTCVEKGYTTHTCTNCGDSYVDTQVDALGHDMDEWTTVMEATCTEDGSERRDCSRCDRYETRIIEARGHSYDAAVTKPTCTEQGYTQYVCSVCGDSYISDYVVPTGHDHKTVVTAPTCTEQGYTTYTCHCGDSYISDYTDPLGHDMGAWETATEAACTENGEEIRECSRCDHSESRDIEALGHDWNEGIITVEPTDETVGELTYTCSRCGETRTEVIPELEHEHRYDAVVTAPTCTEQGYTTHTCRCGDSYVDTYVEALGHGMGEWFTVTEATCTADGMEECDCSRCEYHETQVIEATGHDYESVVTDPTCSAQGFTTHTCHCGDSYIDSYTAALGHSFTTYVSDGNATCTQDGTKTAKCDHCDLTDTIPDVGSALGHAWGDWIVIQEPTTTENGVEEHTCTRCGHTEQRSIAKLENPFNDVAPGSFFYEPVMWAIENGITNGTSATTFAPKDECTRGHVVTFLWRAAGSPEPQNADNPFTDVKEGKFYYKAVLWAVENGITAGMTSTTFEPDTKCTRGQVVTFLWRAMGKPEPQKTQHPFTDVAEGKFYYQAMLWAVEEGITNGMTATTFAPDNICNRGQVVTFLYRAFVND